MVLFGYSLKHLRDEAKRCKSVYIYRANSDYHFRFFNEFCKYEAEGISYFEKMSDDDILFCDYEVWEDNEDAHDFGEPVEFDDSDFPMMTIVVSHYFKCS